MSKLFADDFSISLQFSNPHRATRLLLLNLNNISSWASDRGFAFPAVKQAYSYSEINAVLLHHLPLSSYKASKLTFSNHTNFQDSLLTKNFHGLFTSNFLKLNASAPSTF